VTVPELVVLDRDGTLNRKAPSGNYILHPEEVILLPGAARAVARLNRSGVRVVVATNQRCIGLGLADAPTVDEVHATIATALEHEGGRVDRWYVCPHLEGMCQCRKPQPGMLLDALAYARASPLAAVMIGDSDIDIEAATRAGMRAVRLGDRVDEEAWATVASLDAAVDVLLRPMR
jgi:D-glycero-D-manno-heptose 1,7-bisphosphate phosphatase